MRDIVTTTEEAIESAEINCADEARHRARALVRYSPERRKINLEVRKYLYQKLYYNPEVHRPNLDASKCLRDLFEYYMENPEEIGLNYRARAERIGWPRAICDYLSGMTDRYALDDHKRLFRV